MENIKQNFRHRNHRSYCCEQTAEKNFSPAHSSHSQRNFSPVNKRGFALALALTLIPFFLGSVLAAGGLFAYLYAKNELFYQCERSLLKAQDTLLQGEEKILRLNPQIEQLVLEKRILNKALMVAPTPIERVAIRAELTRIELALYSLKLQQNFLKISSEQRAQYEMFLAERTQLQKLRDFSQLWKARLFAHAFKTVPRMQIIAKPIDPSAKIYKIPPQMSFLQTLTLRWSLSGTSLFPRWMQFLHSRRFYWQDSCSTYPQHTKDTRWHAEIGAAALF